MTRRICLSAFAPPRGCKPLALATSDILSLAGCLFLVSFTVQTSLRPQSRKSHDEGEFVSLPQRLNLPHQVDHLLNHRNRILSATLLSPATRRFSCPTSILEKKIPLPFTSTMKITAPASR